MNTQNHAAIKKALEPTFEALKAACKAQLETEANQIRNHLEAANMDAHAAYPYPRAYQEYPEGHAYRHGTYQFLVALYNRAGQLTVEDPEREYSRNMNDPHFKLMREDVAEIIEKESSAYARSFLDSYAIKLTAKVSSKDEAFNITEASYNGTLDPFSRSQLVCSSEQGQMTWNTTCIINVSKLGKLFNQWPTRLAAK